MDTEEKIKGPKATTKKCQSAHSAKLIFTGAE